ncbi:unconventional prefoldin RPB5 interactor isoform X2 [Palaemon carinicauda]|uniref:unconventional prefoldin RPB5 interactor isoform X2 n=1 Tax=Palaemon carinicauda TaxID=392227 RepID=UPI0035B58716
MKKRSASDSGSEKDETGIKYSLRTLQDNLDNLAELQQEHRQKFELVEKEYNQLTKFKDDYLHLQKRLRTLPDKTSHEVMVPIGPLAFMPGRLIHTNEILVLLGDNWFAERSAKEAIEIVNRRVKDCNEKIKSAENQMNLHKNWLKETSSLFEEGRDQVEIIEELTEEEFERSKEEHRRKLAEDYEKRKQATDQGNPSGEEMPEGAASTSQENFIEKLDEDDKKAYENLMRRLDQLEIEEDEESDGSQDADDYERYIRRSKIHEEISSANDVTEHAAGTEDEDLSAPSTPVLYKRNKRRVSWADDTRPLATVIPVENSESTYRIKYTTKQLSLPLIEWDPASSRETPEENNGLTESSSAVIQSPSDLYKTFGERRGSLPDPPVRGILKKTHSSSEASSSLCSGLIPARWKILLTSLVLLYIQKLFPQKMMMRKMTVIMMMPKNQ